MAAMDGAAVRSQDTVGAGEGHPLTLKMGQEAFYLDTGDPLPEGTDAVIMIENIQPHGKDAIEIMASVAPWQHVRTMGEDIVASQLILPPGHRIRPHDVGALLAGGLTHIPVRRRPRVVVIPTGTELVQPGSPLKPGDIIEFNSLMLAAMVEDWGGQPVRWDPVPDDRDRLRSTILEALESTDVLVVNAGSSAGSEDYTARLVEELGELLVHGVALRPGHPVVLGVVRGKPVLGIPGYAVSAVITSEIFLKPLVARMLGTVAAQRSRETATLARKVHSPMGEDEFLRVRLGRVGGRLVATPVQRGAGVIMSLVRADGLVVIPRLSEGIEAGEDITVELLRPIDEIEGTIVVTGSHDLAIDLLANDMSLSEPGARIASSNVGSLGGLQAVSRGEAHLAGSHLLDEETGEYNLSFVRRYLKGRDVVVVNLVRRVQGLILPKGNPRGLTSLDDLAREGVTFVNRQRGSGTRVLLDYKLKESGVDPERINGYGREEYTHLTVAAAVAGGSADVGLGILSAAKAMRLDFVPLATEQYDLIIPAELYDGDLLRPMLALIRSVGFRKRVDALGGYDTSTTGDVVA